MDTYFAPAKKLIDREKLIRNFSTKAQAGRGVGTFSMKLFGEGYLGGKVDFTTSASAGTVFRITLPLTIGK